MSKTALYIGEKELKGVKKGVVTFVDGSQTTYTEKQLTYMVTKEPQDLTKQRDLMLMNVVPEVMDVFEQHDIRTGDLEAIIHVIRSTYDNTLQIAMGKAFGTYKDGTNPANFQDDIKVSDLKRVSGK